MKENLRKIKNIIGLIAFVAIGVLGFLGINYEMANGIAAAFLALVILAIAFLFVFLALKGREERRGHSKTWIAIGWVSSVLYFLTLLLFVSSINHFISINQKKTTIQDEAIAKIEAMEKTNADFYEKVDERCEGLKNSLYNLIRRDEDLLLRNIYPMHSGDFTYQWVMTQKNNLFLTICDNEVDKLSYNMISKEWDGQPQTMSAEKKQAVKNWNVLSISQTMQELDEVIEKNINVLQTSYALSEPYSQYFNLSHAYIIDEPTKSQVENKIYDTHFQTAATSGLGYFIAWFLILLAAFPIIFVPLNRVRKNNKRFANIYEEGFPISDF